MQKSGVDRQLVGEEYIIRMEYLLPRQQQGGAGTGGAGGNAAKPKDPMLQPAGPGLPPWIVWLPKLHSRVAFNILWWILTGVVGALAIAQAFRIVRALRLRKRGAARPSPGSARSTAIESPTPRAGAMAKLYAMRAAWTNFTHVRVPLYFFPNHSVSEWFWTAAYVALVIGLTFWGATYKGKRNYTRVFGLASISQIPLIVGLAGRNNLISLLTGISYEKLNWLHRVAGRTCVLTAWTHMGAMVGQVGKPVVNPKNLTTATGILALTCISLMFLSSFGVFRRLAYEAFIALHICMGIALLVALYYHRPMYRHWIWASMVIWGFDRAVSFAKAVYANLGRKSDQASVTLLGSNAVRVVAHAPKLKWRAGQHAFLIMPSVARLGLESHPFTMANVPSETGEAVFIVRAHTGFTRRLVEHLQSSEGQVKCFVDGPYGLPPMLDHYAGVLLVAGGTGITYALSHLLGIAKGARAGKSAVATARLVWNVRERDDPISWISPMLGDIAAEGLHVRVDVYLTSYGSGDPTEPALGEHKEGGHPASPTSNPEKEGLSDQSHNGLLVVQRGRADIEAIARSDIADVPRDAGGMAVVVCGPTSLAMDARRAVCRVNSAGAVANGQVPIEFYVETFGW